MQASLFDETKIGVQFNANVFYYLHVTPQPVQMMIQNVSPEEENFRTGPIALTMYACLGVSAIAQIYLGTQEY